MTLYVKRLCGDADDLAMAMFDFCRSLPRWMLHGCAYCGVDGSDTYTNILFCEDEGTCGVPIVESDLTDAEKKVVLGTAARQALTIALHRDNYREFGEHLLDKYPECRHLESVDAALIEACLKERGAVYAEEDYEEI